MRLANRFGDCRGDDHEYLFRQRIRPLGFGGGRCALFLGRKMSLQVHHEQWEHFDEQTDQHERRENNQDAHHGK